MSSPDYIEIIQNSNNVRDLIKKIFETKTKKNNGLSMTGLAQKSGLSKSMISQYLAGKKQLSQNSFNKLISCFNMPKEVKCYLKELHEFEFNIKQNETPEIINSIHIIKKKFYNSIKIESLSSESKKESIKNREALKVFASLGPVQKGAKLEEIIQKSNVEEKKIADVLEVFTRIGLAEYRNGRFYPILDKVRLIKPDDQEFGLLIESFGKEIVRNSKHYAANKNAFVELTAFSMPASKMFQFKLKLREAIFQVMDEFQDDEGDCVFEIGVFGR